MTAAIWLALSYALRTRATYQSTQTVDAELSSFPRHTLSDARLSGTAACRVLRTWEFHPCACSFR